MSSRSSVPDSAEFHHLAPAVMVQVHYSPDPAPSAVLNIMVASPV